MAEKKYSGKSGSESKSSDRKPRRSFSKDSSSGSAERSSYKKDDSRPRKTSSDKNKSFSKFSKDKYSSSDRNDKFKKSDKPFREKRTSDSDSKFEKKPYSREDKFKKDDSDKSKRSYDKSYFDKDSRDKRKNDDGDKPKRSYDKSYFDKGSRDGGDKYKKDKDEKPGRSFDKGSRDSSDKYKKDKDEKHGRSFDKGPRDRNDKYKKDTDTKPRRSFDKDSGHDKKRSYSDDKGEKRFKSDDFKEGRGFKGHDKDKKEFRDKHYKKKDSDHKAKKHNDDGLIRLNKYLANAGISSRRDADTLILSGTVKVNGAVVDTLGYKVKPTDVVTYADSTIKNERKVYLLLNKPKDFITTTDDPQERRTVMELVRPACKERIYPVGRLDRNTTGLLLFTNDGDIATKLMHPKHEIKKVYHVTLNKPMRGEDYKAVGDGIVLDDGPVKVDDIAFVGEGKKEIGLEIHSGKNRIVRRIFEHLGYEVVKLDRVSYAGLTKKDLPRGKYRFLTDKEISYLKMLG